jgi:hypothetical protein
MPFGTFSPTETFLAAHAFTWFSSAQDTTDLAAEVNNASALRRWQASHTYVQACRPSFPDAFQVDSPPVENPTSLTVAQGCDVFAAFLDAYNRLGATETFLFSSYIYADPAAWPDWPECLGSSE